MSSADKEELPQLLRSAAAYLGHFNSALHNLQGLCQMATSSDLRTAYLQQDLIAAKDKFTRQYGRYTDCIEKIMIFTQEGDFESKREKVDKDYQTHLKNALVALSSFPSSNTGVSRTVTSQAPHGHMKPNEALRPEKLTKDFTPAEFRAWKDRFHAYFTTSGMSTCSISEQQAYFRNCLDPSLEVRIQHKLRPEMPPYSADTDVQSCVDILDAEFMLIWPKFVRRYEFFSSSQSQGQSFSDWTVHLRQLGNEADIQGMTLEDHYVMRYICGVTEDKLREKFMDKSDPSLVDLEEITAAYEAGKVKCKSLRGSKVHLAQTQRQEKSSPKSNDKGSRNKSFMKGQCWRCGASADQHIAPDCRHINSTCNNCNKKGHISRVCAQKAQNTPKSRPRSQSNNRCNNVSSQSRSQGSEESDSSAAVTKAVFVRKAELSTKATPMVWVEFRHSQGSFSCNAIPDSGTAITIISEDIANRHNVAVDTSKNLNLFAANGTGIKTIGSATFNCKIHDRLSEVVAVVSPELKGEILLGWQDLINLGILHAEFPAKVNRVESSLEEITSSLTEKYQDVFADTVKPMKGPPMHIYLDDSKEFKPRRVLTARQIPLHYNEEANRLIKELIDNEILTPVSEPTEVICAGFFVPKEGGKLRLVTDYTPINKFIRRPVHPFPSSRDIANFIPAGTKFFCKLDAVQGYFQIPLDEESSKLTTFLIPSGRYRYLRAPMGLSASSDEWCSRSDAALSGLQGVKKLVDDILIMASSEEELLERLDSVLERCRKHGITISKKKMRIGTEVKFAGYVLTPEGVTPDPDKTAAIHNFPQPTDVTSLRSFLGLANQLGHFIPDLAHLTEPLRQLLKKNTTFQWLPDHETSFQRIKDALTSPLVVQFYDRNLPTDLLTDASRTKGLGYALIQRGEGGRVNLTQCGSCSLSSAQKNYATIELEALAILWAVQHCKYFLRGAPKFRVITDHRPLLGVFQKPLGETDNKRLQSIREKLVDYDFELEWSEGKNHCIADALSRAPCFDSSEEECRVHLVYPDLALQEIYQASQDPRYQDIITAVSSDKKVKNLPPHHPGQAFKSVWGDLSIAGDLLLYKDRMVIPINARRKILQLLHISHSGIYKTKKLAQQLYFWPGINRDIKEMIDACSVCQELQPSQPLDELQPFTPALQPMEKISIDIFECAGKHYLVMVDRFSGFPMVKQLTKLSTSAVTKILTHWFQDWGRPIEICSDNGPQFRTEFDSFCKDLQVTHVTSSPYHPSSNGLAEAAVKQVKNLLKKVGGYQELLSSLAEWRCVPRHSGNKSPAELFLGRRPRGALPTLQPQASSSENTAVSRFKKGDTVRIQNPLTRKWDQTGEIIETRNSKRSYIIHTNGKEIVRNQRFLRSVPKNDECKVTATESFEIKPCIRRSERLSDRKVHFQS